MPTSGEFTSLWWRAGFPGIIEEAPWHQCLETGTYGLIFDSEEIAFPHFGALEGGATLESLPPSDLRLSLEVDGKTYHCTKGGEWSKFTGPRIIDSGRFFQRADVTDLVFAADDKSQLNVEARFEIAAWHDRLSLILAARPGETSLATDRKAFGKAGGGFGLDGANRFEIPEEATAGLSALTLSFDAFVPPDFKAGAHSPWLLCKSGNELADGNLGITLDSSGVPTARLNPGGGRENAVALTAASRHPLNFNEWNHLVLSYDGRHFRFHVNGKLEGEEKFGTARPLVASPIAFGQRQDSFGDGYPFRGIVDEIRLYNRIVEPAAIENGSAGNPTSEWAFDPDGPSHKTRPRDPWNTGIASVSLQQGEVELSHSIPISGNSEWSRVALPLDPVHFAKISEAPTIAVEATEFATGGVREVAYDEALGWHRVNLDGVAPIPPTGTEGAGHDALERIRLTLSNPGGETETARLMFEKTARGIHQRIGTPITGISAILRDSRGNPTGIPVQLSKNWHHHPAAGAYSGQWFHGISQITLPPDTITELELTIAYGHWGGVPAASHAQLSLIGWGSNQRWDQSALGAWGESVCYEPDQIQGKATITDVRPLMVLPMNGREEWSWTGNVGGGDFFRLFDSGGNRKPHASMQATYHRHGPCLTEVTYAGRISSGLPHSTTVSIGRTDDIVRATYRIRLDVEEAFPFSRFVIFQVGADTYNMTHEAKFSVGNEDGLLREWKTTPGGDRYQAEPLRVPGAIPWISMHDGSPVVTTEPKGAWANRGIVIRSWKARLGGVDAAPWVAEYGVGMRRGDSSLVDLVPPPSVTSLEPGDYVEATIEHVIIPQSKEDYLGPNTDLIEALASHANTWKMIEREAIGNSRLIDMKKGALVHRYPDIRVKTSRSRAHFILEGGIGFIPVTFTHLKHPDRSTLFVNGKALDQSVHGNDFWQTDYDPESMTWARTYNIPTPENAPLEIELR
ncbi:MAG: LamG domain-containing protein [Verrucomicrobiales bacterium]|nr:LamG domain-containing protein [Verrucomicrobiales bacterium]